MLKIKQQLLQCLIQSEGTEKKSDFEGEKFVGRLFFALALFGSLHLRRA